MQSTGNLVIAVIKFTSSMQHRHNDFCCRLPFFVDIRRNPPAIIRNRHGFIGMHHHPNNIAVPLKCFVNRIINELLNHMMQSGAIISIANVHSGPLSNRI